MKTIWVVLLNVAFVYYLSFMALPAGATVTNIVWYHFGEKDPGAVSGATMTTTIDSVASNNLVFSGSPKYTNDVAATAAADTGSTLSAFLPALAFATNKIVSAVVDNFGIEAWVKPVEITNGQIIAYNGSTSTSGWGLTLGPTNFFGLYGGHTIITAAAAQTNVWTHIALVRASGVATIYINGVAIVTNSASPGVPTGNFGVGAPPQATTSQFYNGGIDELRVFTFGAGQFSVNDLLFSQPEMVTSLTDGGPGSLRTVLSGATPGTSVTFATNGLITLTNGPIKLATNVNLIGPGPANLIISGAHSNRVFIVNYGSTNFISGVAIENGQADTNYNSGGGGIYNAGNLTLSNCEISFNVAGPGSQGYAFSPPVPSINGGVGGLGGGIFNSNLLQMTACFVHDNTGGVGGTGGAGNGNQLISPSAGGPGGGGGGIYNSGTANFFACSFTTNSGGLGGAGGNQESSQEITGAASGGAGGQAGAIFNDAGGEMILTDCTIYGNTAGTGGPGSPGVIVLTGFPPIEGGTNGSLGTNGGVVNSGVLELYNVTIAGNQGFASGGGVYNNGELAALNTLIASNMASFAPDYAGSFSTMGHNLIGNNQGAFGFFAGNDDDLVGVSNAPINALTGPFSNNGGLTGTVALLAGSPAIDAGDDAIIGSPDLVLTDQRGAVRKSGAHVDIGAYEYVVGFPPKIVSAFTGTNTGFKITFSNTPFARFNVLTSSNVTARLTNWTLLGAAVEITPGSFQFTDTATNTSPRFYTVRSQ